MLREVMSALLRSRAGPYHFGALAHSFAPAHSQKTTLLHHSHGVDRFERGDVRQRDINEHALVSPQGVLRDKPELLVNRPAQRRCVEAHTFHTAVIEER